MKKTESLQISEDVSKYLFLSNLKLDNSSDDKIKDLILSLNTAIKCKSNKTYLDSLEYKFKHIRYRNMLRKIEEKKIKNKKRLK